MLSKRYQFLACCKFETNVNDSDLYYRDPSLFGSQATVDRYVDTIAASLGVTRADLSVVCQ